MVARREADRLRRRRPRDIRFVSPDGKAAPTPPAWPAESGLSWSPDSTRLAFDRYVETKDGGRSVAVVLDLATGREAVFTGEQHGARSPAWSPEGDQVAFLSMSERETTHEHDLALVRR